MPHPKQNDPPPPQKTAQPPKKKGPVLDYQRAAIEAAFCRMSARAGLKVLQYALKPGERVSGHGEHVRHIVTVELPRAGQLVFGFTQEHSDLLAGMPRTSSATIRLEDLTEQDFETLVRGMLACFPGRLEEAGTIPWNGQDSNPTAHADLLNAVG